jgi:hypothetical protein
MEKRYQVFLSSTYQDLSAERLEVIKALLELDCIPCGMEYFPAASEDAWSYIASLIDQCDYYVVVVGGRYGSLTPEGISFTEKEYAYALSKGVPTIAFLHATPQDLPVKKTEQSDEGRKRLAAFVEKLKSNLCKEWSTAHELGAVVSRSLTQLMKRHPRVGWIPASNASDPRAAQELLEMTKKVVELEKELMAVRGKASHDISDLADGADILDVAVTYTVSQESKKKNAWPRDEAVANYRASVSVSWKDIFRVFAPRLAPTAADSAVKRVINDLLKARLSPGKGTVADGQWVSGVRISDEHYNTIKIQFLALGDVTIGKEQYADGAITQVLWRLTEKGEARMIKGMAIRKAG